MQLQIEKDSKAAFHDSLWISTSKKPYTQPHEEFPYQAQQRLQTSLPMIDKPRLRCLCNRSSRIWLGAKALYQLGPV